MSGVCRHFSDPVSRPRSRPLFVGLALIFFPAPKHIHTNTPAEIDLDNATSVRAGLLHALMDAFNCDSNLSSSDGDVQTYSSSTGPIASLSSAATAAAAAPGDEDGRGTGGSVCSCCGAALRVVGLDSPARARVRSALRRLAAETASPTPPLPPLPQPRRRRRQSSRLDSAYTGEGQRQGDQEQGQQGEERVLGEEAMGNLAQFAAWLEERRREVRVFAGAVSGGRRVSSCLALRFWGRLRPG